jgi:mono/diheme cytochrome c family protein
MDHSNDRMRKTPTGAALAAILVLAAAAVAIAQSPSPKEPPVDWQPLWMQRELWGPGTMPPGMRARLLRHHTYMQYGLQPEYQGAKSTVGNDRLTIEAGASLYAQRCASCHGRQGMGDGDAPRSLLPSPALLAFVIQRPISVDEYLLWSIAEGRKQFDTEMPAFKTILTRDEIWQIIAYMRAGFPLDPDRPARQIATFPEQDPEPSSRLQHAAASRW